MYQVAQKHAKAFDSPTFSSFCRLQLSTYLPAVVPEEGKNIHFQKCIPDDDRVQKPNNGNVATQYVRNSDKPIYIYISRSVGHIYIY